MTDRHIENLNYATDPRTRNYPQDQTELVYFIDDYDTEVRIPIPEHAYEWTVCDLCLGEGKHVNPSIDCNGLTAEDFHADPDFADEYMRGTYDVPCAQCHGRTTIRVVNPEKFLDAEQLAEYRAYCVDQARMDAEAEAERLGEMRMGA